MSPTKHASTERSSSTEGSTGCRTLSITSPYTWKVIGEAQTIATALDIQAGSAAQMRAKGAIVQITPSDDLSITSLATPKPPQFATYG